MLSLMCALMSMQIASPTKLGKESCFEGYTTLGWLVEQEARKLKGGCKLRFVCFWCEARESGMLTA